MRTFERKPQDRREKIKTAYQTDVIFHMEHHLGN